MLTDSGHCTVKRSLDISSQCVLRRDKGTVLWRKTGEEIGKVVWPH